MPDPRRSMLGHLKPRQSKRETEDMRRLTRLLAATAAAARHNALIDAIEQLQQARNARDFGTRLGTLEGAARKMLQDANKRAGLTTEPRPIPGKGQEPGGLWLPPGTERPDEADR